MIRGHADLPRLRLSIFRARTFFPLLALLAHPETSRPHSMAKVRTGIIEAISRRLRVMYDGIIAEGVPDRLAAILSTADEDLAALPARSLVA